MTEKHTISVIISSYNYAQFVGATIQSVLHQTRKPDEIIVVDDGSHDGSQEVIQGFSDHVTVILKDNGGQASALNAGYEISSGDIVFFLDSDDLLLPDCLRDVEEQWTASCAKTQFAMMTIDENGTERGVTRPAGRLSRGDLRDQVLRTGCYTTTPTSGNAFARSALRELMPIPEKTWKTYADCYLLFLVPFFGNIQAIDKISGHYRVHASNASALFREGSVQLRVLHSEIKRDIKQQDMLQRFCTENGYALRRDAVLSNWYSLKLRLASKRLDPQQHPAPGETRSHLALKALQIIWTETGLSLRRRLAFSSWIAGMCIAPRRCVAPLASLAIKKS